MLCGVFVIVKFHIEKRKDGLFLPMIGVVTEHHCVYLKGKKTLEAHNGT